MQSEIMENEKKWAMYDNACEEVYRKAKSVVGSNKFIDEFNDTFSCEVDKHGIPDGFYPATPMKRGNIKRDWLKSYIWNLIYDLFQNGCHIGIKKINDKWENVVDEDRHFVRTDKFYGVFLLDYKLEQMFPNDEKRFRNFRKFTRLRIKLNTPNSEWIKVI